VVTRNIIQQNYVFVNNNAYCLDSLTDIA